MLEDRKIVFVIFVFTVAFVIFVATAASAVVGANMVEVNTTQVNKNQQ